MAKRTSIESRIVEYFESAPLADARIVYNIINGKMKLRVAASESGVASKPKAKRAPRRKLPVASATTETAVAPV